MKYKTLREKIAAHPNAVSWRWRKKGWRTWSYYPYLGWLAEQSPNEIEAEPLAVLDDHARLTAERDALRAAVRQADEAIAYYLRYLNGGETRGSYDGKPERNALVKAGYATRAALNNLSKHEKTAV